MADLNLTSPAAAFSRQARNEAKVTSAIEWAMRLFLADVTKFAHADRLYLSPAAVSDAWATRMGVAALATRLDPLTAAYVAEAQAPSSVPSEAYDTAMAVLVAANERAWSAQLTSDVLDLALSMDTPPMTLTAAAPRRDSKRGKELSAAFETALARDNRMSWGDVAKRDARTAVTGLDGMISTALMQQAGYAEKRWVARKDARVREAHADADGQTVPVSAPFTVGGYPMMHPGDRSAPVALTVNCRCVCVAVA